MDGIWITVSFLRLADRCNRVCGLSGQLRCRGERKWSSVFLNTLELFCIELSLEAFVFYDLAVCLVGWLVGCLVGCLVVRLLGWLVDCTVGWYVGCTVGSFGAGLRTFGLARLKWIHGGARLARGVPPGSGVVAIGVGIR